MGDDSTHNIIIMQTNNCTHVTQHNSTDFHKRQHIKKDEEKHKFIQNSVEQSVSASLDSEKGHTFYA